MCFLHRTEGAGVSQGRSGAECTLALTASFHEKAFLCQQKSFTRAIFLGDRARGLALLRGEPPFLRRGGNPPAPAFPFRGNGKGDQKIPSLLPQAMNSVYSRFITSLHNRRFALLPFALFVEQFAPVPVGVLNIVFGCCHLGIRTEPLREERRSLLMSQSPGLGDLRKN